MFCNVMAIFFPTIDLFTNTSNFPEITRLYMSLMLMFFPFAVLMPLCEFSREKRLLIPLPSKDTPEGKKYVRSATVMVLVLPLLIYFQWFVNPGLDIFWMDFSRSRADLAWFGFAITLVTPFFIGMFLHLAVRFFVEAKPIN